LNFPCLGAITELSTDLRVLRIVAGFSLLRVLKNTVDSALPKSTIKAHFAVPVQMGVEQLVRSLQNDSKRLWFSDMTWMGYDSR
jgi:hypothetical protein